MTDQSNPYAPWKPPFRYDEDDQIWDAQGAYYGTVLGGPLTARRIVDLLNRDAEKSLLAENERLQEELSIMTQAVGLATTAVPDMEIDVTDPIGMMHKVVAEVARLREENAKLVKELAAIREDIADEAAFRESRKIDAAREEQRRRD